MTQEQKDAVIGRVSRERREADHNLALLQSEAKRIAEKLRSIASWLESNPNSIIFDDESLDARLGAWQNRIHSSDLDIETFKKLVADLRETGKRAKEKNLELEGLLPKP